MAEPDYRPNRFARSLRSRKSRVLGLILSDIRNPFFSAISRAVDAVICLIGERVERNSSRRAV